MFSIPMTQAAKLMPAFQEDFSRGGMVGIESTKSKIYIPNSVKSISNKSFALKNFNGDNHQEIADNLGITKRSVYRLLKN